MGKLMDLLTICRKAGQLELGFDPMKEALASGKARAVITAADISPKTEKEVRFFAERKNVPTARSEITLDDAHMHLGKRAGVFTVCGEEFAKKALGIIETANSGDPEND